MVTLVPPPQAVTTLAASAQATVNRSQGPEWIMRPLEGVAAYVTPSGWAGYVRRLRSTFLSGRRESEGANMKDTHAPRAPLQPSVRKRLALVALCT